MADCWAVKMVDSMVALLVASLAETKAGLKGEKMAAVTADSMAVS